MAEILLRAEDARGYATEMSTAADEADGTITRLSNRLTSLSDSFRGAAQQKFEEKYQEWRDGQTKAKEALDDLSRWLNGAADHIEQVDQQLAQGLG